jgi:hypothetical protein
MVPELTLDERFSELRRAVDDEVACAKSTLLQQLSRALSRLESAGNHNEWRTAADESAASFADDPAALQLLEKLAALTAPKIKIPLGQDHDLRLRAQRFARVRVAEIQLYEAAAVQSGRAARNLYQALRPQIDSAREAFRERFLTAGQPVSDYLHAELVRTLANEDAELLGPDYPGSMA